MGDPGQHAGGEPTQGPVEALPTRQEPQYGHATGEEGDALERLVALGSDEADEQRRDTGDDAGVAEGHQPQDDLAADGVGDDRLRFVGRVADTHERRAGLEASRLGGEARPCQRDRRHAGDGHEQGDDDDQRRDGDHGRRFLPIGSLRSLGQFGDGAGVEVTVTMVAAR